MKNVAYLTASEKQYSLSVRSDSILNVMCDLLGAGEDHLT